MFLKLEVVEGKEGADFIAVDCEKADNCRLGTKWKLKVEQNVCWHLKPRKKGRHCDLHSESA